MVPEPQKHEPMKRIFALLIAAVGWCGIVAAEEPQNPTTPTSETPYEEQTFVQRFLNWNVPNLDTKNEVRLGLPLPDFYFVDNLRYKTYSSGLQGDYLNATQQEGGLYVHTSPLINFMVRCGKRWECGVSGFYAQARQNLYHTVTTDVIKSSRTDVLAISPTLRWNLIRASWIRFYLQTGINYYLANKSGEGLLYESDLFFGYGYTVGKKVFFFSEGNYGSESIVVTMGVGYRF